MTDKDTGERPRGPAVVVICTAIATEYEAARRHLVGPVTEWEDHRGSLYEIGSAPGRGGTWRVVLAQAGVGNTTTGVHVERAIANFSPRVVLFVGVAGGRKDVRLGDVVVADAIYDYESGKETPEGYVPRIKTQAPSHRLVQRAAAVARKSVWQRRLTPICGEPGPDALVKPIAAGSKVVAHSRSATEELLARYCGDAVAVEMEGYGFLQGAYLNAGVDALVIRGISDVLTAKDEANDAIWQPRAAKHAAAFAFELLANMAVGPVRSRSRAVWATLAAALVVAAIALAGLTNCGSPAISDSGEGAAASPQGTPSPRPSPPTEPINTASATASAPSGPTATPTTAPSPTPVPTVVGSITSPLDGAPVVPEVTARGSITSGVAQDSLFVATRLVGSVAPKTAPAGDTDAVYLYPVTVTGATWEATVYVGDSDPDKSGYIFDIYLVQASPAVAADLRTKLGRALPYDEVSTTVRLLDHHRVVRS